MRRRRSSKRWAGIEVDEFDLALGVWEVVAHYRGRVSAGDALIALERAWRVRGEELTEARRRDRPGHRMWAWWRFTAQEEQPAHNDEPRRLFEMGELDDVEIDAIVAAGREALRLAPYALGQTPPPLRVANNVLEAMGEPLLPVWFCTDERPANWPTNDRLNGHEPNEGGSQ